MYYFSQHTLTVLEHILCAQTLLGTKDTDLFDSFHKYLLSTYDVLGRHC